MATKKTAAIKAKASVKKPATKKASASKKSPAKSDASSASLPAAKKQKVKVVRDSFTMPQSEYQKLAEIKAICLKSKVHVKKSEVLRAGLKVLAKLNAAQLKSVLNGLEKIKTGRPKKH